MSVALQTRPAIALLVDSNFLLSVLGFQQLVQSGLVTTFNCGDNSYAVKKHSNLDLEPPRTFTLLARALAP